MKRFIIVLFAILTINFLLPRLMPGDPFLTLSAEDGFTSVQYSEQEVQNLKEYYGLDKPIATQFIEYYANVLKGDFGRSIFYNESVNKILLRKLPWTIFIVLSSLLIGCIVGLSLGILSMINRNKNFDKVFYTLIITVSEIPSFLIGIAFLFIFAANLGWFPLSGGVSAFTEPSFSLSYIEDILSHAFLPILTMSIPSIGQFYILSRSSMITIISKDYIITGKAKGLSKKRLNIYYILKNSLSPIISRVFLNIGHLFAASILVENVFAYPGIGTLMKESVLKRDYPLIQAIFLIIALLVLLMNYLAEHINRKIDPRGRDDEKI
ncbi:MAG: ABC transporter permease [Sphaerochaeta sp.]